MTRPWVWALCALVLIGVVLQGVRVWLEATGRKVSIRVARPEIGEHVDTNFPIRIDVLREVYPIAAASDNAGYVYQGTESYTFTNMYHDEIRIRLPLLRMAYARPGSTSYRDHAQLAPEWKTPQTFVLKKGMSASITVPVLGDESTPLPNLAATPPDHRVALVFGCPDGEDPDKYVVGTILSEPIRWQKIPKPSIPETAPSTRP